MHTQNYRIETTTGEPVFTDGRTLTLTRKPNSRIAEGTASNYSDRLLQHYGKKLGAALRLVPAGTVEIINIW